MKVLVRGDATPGHVQSAVLTRRARKIRKSQLLLPKVRPHLPAVLVTSRNSSVLCKSSMRSENRQKVWTTSADCVTCRHDSVGVSLLRHVPRTAMMRNVVSCVRLALAHRARSSSRGHRRTEKRRKGRRPWVDSMLCHRIEADLSWCRE